MAEPKRGSIWKLHDPLDDTKTNYSVKFHGKIYHSVLLEPGDEVVIYQSLDDGSMLVSRKSLFTESKHFTCVWPGPPYGE